MFPGFVGWVTGAFTHHMVRVLEGGKITHDLDLGQRSAYACMLGGQDRRTLYVQETAPGELHIFSGKVVSAVKAARLVAERVAQG